MEFEAIRIRIWVQGLWGYRDSSEFRLCFCIRGLGFRVWGLM